MKILLVEDDSSLSEFLTQSLKTHRYTVETVTDGAIALDMAAQLSYDLIVLDLMIPKVDGISVCQQLREQGCRVPILMLTAKGSDDDVIKGLDAGADDYVTKPCQVTQLLARIRALIRRKEDVKAERKLQWGVLILDPNSAKVTYAQSLVNLSPKEYSLLELFLRNPQRIFSRGAVIDHLWTIDETPSDAAVTNLIKDLRHKLKKAGMKEELIETVFRLGYRLFPSPDCDPSSMAEGQEIDESMSEGVALINQIAEEYKLSLAKQVEELATQVRSLTTATPAPQQQIQNLAHRLIGGLGTIGWMQGSEIARVIEQAIADNTNDNATIQPQLLQWIAKLQTELQPVASLPCETTAFELPTAIVALSPPASPVWVISSDPLFFATLQRATTALAYPFEVTLYESSFWENGATQRPIAIVWDIGETFSHQQAATFQELKIRFPESAVIAVSDSDDLNTRVAVGRLEITHFMLKSSPVENLLQAISQVQATRDRSTTNVMVVDDDPVMLQSLTQLLAPWGVQVVTLADPERFWQVLKATNPEVLILDMKMPNFSGTDLCQVVRQDHQYSDLPILVVTASTSVATIQQVFAAGADDYVSKPIAGPEFVTRVMSRIERSRTHRQLQQFYQTQTAIAPSSPVDPLTQLPNRYQLIQVLEQQWQQGIHTQAAMSLILCDLDAFQAYNDEQTWAKGDQCLQTVARSLQRVFRQDTDLIARYEGDLFAIWLPQTHVSEAVVKAEQIQAAIAQLQIPHPTSPTGAVLTVSLGITGTIPTLEKSGQTLYAMAAQALQSAKERGGNTYCLYPY